jgi:hypothetical protein
MGRSGTRVVTSMFISAGFHAGPPPALMPANYANPSGSFERKEIVEPERLGAPDHGEP